MRVHRIRVVRGHRPHIRICRISLEKVTHEHLLYKVKLVPKKIKFFRWAIEAFFIFFISPIVYSRRYFPFKLFLSCASFMYGLFTSVAENLFSPKRFCVIDTIVVSFFCLFSIHEKEFRKESINCGCFLVVFSFHSVSTCFWPVVRLVQC